MSVHGSTHSSKLYGHNNDDKGCMDEQGVFDPVWQYQPGNIYRAAWVKRQSFQG